MPRYIKNWRFEDVVLFLKQHFFVDIKCRGSHHYFKGLVDGEIRLVEVQYHPNEIINPRTLKHYIIGKSGIPYKFWTLWGNAGSKSAKAKIQYKGAART